MGGKTSTASKQKYNAKTYQRIVLDVRADSPQCKEQAGESLSGYILEAVRRRMEQEGRTAEQKE